MMEILWIIITSVVASGTNQLGVSSLWWKLLSIESNEKLGGEFDCLKHAEVLSQDLLR